MEEISRSVDAIRKADCGNHRTKSRNAMPPGWGARSTMIRGNFANPSRIPPVACKAQTSHPETAAATPPIILANHPSHQEILSVPIGSLPNRHHSPQHRRAGGTGANSRWWTQSAKRIANRRSCLSLSARSPIGTTHPNTAVPEARERIAGGGLNPQSGLREPPDHIPQCDAPRMGGETHDDQQTGDLVRRFCLSLSARSPIGTTPQHRRAGGTGANSRWWTQSAMRIAGTTGSSPAMRCPPDGGREAR